MLKSKSKTHLPKAETAPSAVGPVTMSKPSTGTQAGTPKKNTVQESESQNIEPYVDRTLASRQEIKYLIRESEALAVVNFIKPFTKMDPYSQKQSDGSYSIVSNYFDSPDYRLCRESLNGKMSRFKLRIRSYSDNPGSPCFVEIKRRLNTIIVKSRSRVNPDSIQWLLANECSSDCACYEDDAFRQFMLYKNSLNARGMVKIRYMRQAFEGLHDDRVRITFDRKLCCNVSYPKDVKLNGSGWQRFPINYVVLEIKFTGPYPAWLSRMIQHFGFRSQSVSKYTSSVQQASLLNF